MRDDIPQNIGSPGIQSTSDCISQVLFNSAFGKITFTTESPDGIESRSHNPVVQIYLHYGRFHDGVHAVMLLPGRLVQQKTGRLQPYLHFHNTVGDRLKGPDRLSELAALAGAPDTIIELTFHRADLAGQNAASFPFHRGFEHPRSSPLTAQPV